MSQTNPFSGLSGVTTSEQLNRTKNQGTNDPKKLGVNDFLKMMVAQLKNQDPTKPQVSSQFLAQIAQFGTVSGIEQMNKSMSGLVNSLSSNRGLQAASLVGRDVIAKQNVGPLAEGGNLNGVVDLTKAVNGLTVEVSDLAGNLVSRVSLGPQSAGTVPFAWDGTGLDGRAVAAGSYRVTATATVNGKAEAVPAFTRVKVESVSLSGSEGPVVNLQGGATMKLSDIRDFY